MPKPNGRAYWPIPKGLLPFSRVIEFLLGRIPAGHAHRLAKPSRRAYRPIPKGLLPFPRAAEIPPGRIPYGLRVTLVLRVALVLEPAPDSRRLLRLCLNSSLLESCFSSWLCCPGVLTGRSLKG